MEIDVPLVMTRWLHFVSLMVAFGASFFPLYAVPEGVDQKSLPGLASTGRIVRLAAYLGLASGLAWVGLSLVGMVGDIAGVFDRDTLSAFFLETSFGPVWIARLVLLLCLALVAWGLSDKGSSTGKTALIAVIGAGALASQASIGHAAMASGTELSAELISYMLHVLAAGAWIGGLVPLGLVLADTGRIEAEPRRDLRVEEALLARFSNVGIILVLVILATGIANSAFRLGSAQDLTMSIYGRLILVKALVFALMLVAAAFNRWRLMPRLERCGDQAIAAIRRNILAEQVLGALVLAAAAWLGTLAPQA